ncbi:MAG: CPBP family intramembrane glutamic endopeptidase, partial [Caulobacteraceae bacterium]
RGVWTGLASAPFLACADRRDREPRRIAGALLGGPIVGLVAALATMILVLALYTLAVGLGGEGLEGLRKVALSLRSASAPDLGFTTLELLVVVASNGAFAAAFVAVAAVLARRPFHRCVTVARKVRWRLLGVGLALSLLVAGPLVAMDRLLSGGSQIPPMLAIGPRVFDRAGYALVTLLFIPAAAAEELIFRGWLPRQVAAFTRRPGLLIALSAVAFSAIHLDFSPDGFLTRALMGAGFTYMTLRLGGIEFSTGAHAINNVLIVLFVQPLNLTLHAPAAVAGVTAGSLVEDVAMVAGYVAITELAARVAPLQRWAGVLPEELSPSSVAEPRFG